jgi:curved DNA-binding protein CbpA
VALKNYYELLTIESTASPEEVKRSFRHQIARYHPDKVQHLGKEFQEMAADRAAELTKAYHVLSDEGRRAEYDRARQAVGGGGPSDGGAPVRPDAPPEGAAAQPASTSTGESFRRERASRDDFMRKAVMGRFRQALDAEKADAYDEPQVRGFDVACVPKPKLFRWTRAPRLLGRFVPRVDGEAVADAWTQAARWAGASDDEVCVFLVGPLMTSRRKLEDAIVAQRRKVARGRMILVPIDSRDWGAHIPTDAPPLVRNLLARLRGGV